MQTQLEENNMSKKWYDEYPKAQAPSNHAKTTVEVLELKDEAKRYLSAETSVFHLKESKINSSETIWLKTALTQGTTSDKVAANVVFIQDNPKYNITRLASLISQVRTVKHNQCSMIIEALRDLFLSELLHPQFKLLKLDEQDLDQLEKRKNVEDCERKGTINRNKLLACWFFEDQLREQYERFIAALAGVAQDTVDANREKSVSIMTDLLIGNAEQEHKLLELIVNKIGDPAPKVASKTIFSLNRLLHEHPNMRLVVLKEVEKLLFRKNVAQRAQYYAICLLTQFVLGKADGELAMSLTQVYFAFFKACLKKGEPNSRMMAAILTGVNKSYSFAKRDSEILSGHIDSIYKIVHVGSYNVSLNALTLLYQATGHNESQSDRFYTVFYKKVLNPQIGVMSKRAMFLNLLYRVLEKDPKTLRLCAFIKRILQVTLYFPANMASATLYVISKVFQKRKDVQQLLYKNRLPLNDSSSDLLDKTEPAVTTEDTSDISESESNEKIAIILPNVITQPPSDGNTLNDTDSMKTEADVKTEKVTYDPFCRNPLYACGNKSVTAELIALSRHFHPSAALFASTIVQGKPIDYTGDPLEDLMLIRFLDRYVFKNPKKLEDKTISGKGVLLAAGRSRYVPNGVKSIPIHSASYTNEREDRIPVDELYLYRYLRKKRDTQSLSKREDSDNESVNSDEFNDMLDQLGSGKDFDDFEELDIAADIKLPAKSKKRGLKDGEENNDDSRDDDGVDDDEDLTGDNGDDFSNSGSMNNGNRIDEDDCEFENLSDIDFSSIDGEDLSDMDFNDSADEELDTALSNTMKNVKERKGLRKVKEMNENVFMSAEKFAEMLEEEGKRNMMSGGTDMLSNLDGASQKQLEWETKRNQKFTKKEFFGKKRKAGSSGNRKSVKKHKRLGSKK